RLGFRIRTYHDLPHNQPKGDRQIWQTRTASITAALLGLWLLPLLSHEQASFGPDSKACSLLPISELEAHFGGKATTPRGLSGVSAGSACSVYIKDHRINIHTEPPGALGVPKTIKEGLAGARMILQDAKAKNTIIPLEDKDFG